MALNLMTPDYVCRSCGDAKPRTQFYDWSHDHRCKDCSNAASRTSYMRRTDAQIERDRGRSAAWRLANLDRARTTNRTWQAREKRTDPVGAMLRSAKHRAARDGVAFNLTRADVAVPATCPVLGIALSPNWGGRTFHDASPSLDRIDPLEGYVRGNVAIISLKANRLKSNATTAEIEALAAWMRKAGAP